MLPFHFGDDLYWFDKFEIAIGTEIQLKLCAVEWFIHSFYAWCAWEYDAVWCKQCCVYALVSAEVCFLKHKHFMCQSLLIFHHSGEKCLQIHYYILNCSAAAAAAVHAHSLWSSGNEVKNRIPNTQNWIMTHIVPFHTIYNQVYVTRVKFYVYSNSYPGKLCLNK